MFNKSLRNERERVYAYIDADIISQYNQVNIKLI